jgi:HSP20 family protein
MSNKNKKESLKLSKSNNLHKRLINWKNNWGNFFRMPNLFEDNFFCANDTIIPDINLSETQNGYKILVELPGVDKKDIQVDVKDKYLTVKAEKNDEEVENDENYYRQECSCGLIQRIIKLPDNIKEETMEAKYINGVLKITVKKNEKLESEARKLEIK